MYVCMYVYGVSIQMSGGSPRAKVVLYAGSVFKLFIAVLHIFLLPWQSDVTLLPSIKVIRVRHFISLFIQLFQFVFFISLLPLRRSSWIFFGVSGCSR